MSPSQAAQAAYGALAPYYDAFTAHPAYPGWIRGLEALARSHGLRGRRVLDVGCGTGKSAIPLLDLGYEVTGCDPVPAMLEIAACKAPTARWVRAEIADLPAVGKFDYVSCINDVLSYLLGPEDLAQAFTRLAVNLAPGGVLLFDVNTPALYRSIFSRTERRANGDEAFIWRGLAPPDFSAGDVAVGLIEVIDTDGRRVTTRHAQRAHPEDEIRQGLDRAGLHLAGVYGQLEEGLPQPDFDPDRHMKAIYVARKPR